MVLPFSLFHWTLVLWMSSSAMIAVIIKETATHRHKAVQSIGAGCEESFSSVSPGKLEKVVVGDEECKSLPWLPQMTSRLVGWRAARPIVALSAFLNDVLYFPVSISRNGDHHQQPQPLAKEAVEANNHHW